MELDNKQVAYHSGMEFGEPKYCRGTPEVLHEKAVRSTSGLTTASQKDKTEIMLHSISEMKK